MDCDIPVIDRKGICSKVNWIDIKKFYSEKSGTINKCIENIPEIRKIESLADYFNLLKEIHDKNENRLHLENKNCGSLFLYRGQSSVDYSYSPSILRNENNIKRENLLFKEFHRRFYEIFDDFKTYFEEEVFMQHYGVGSRCLDLLENPLIALWAACTDESDQEKGKCGEVSIWCIDNDSDDYKFYDSSTVCIISSIARLNSRFSLGHVEIDYHREHPTDMKDFIYIKNILRSSVVVRPKYNNQRIKNQQGAFAIMNLTKMRDDGFSEKFGISPETFTEYILNAEEINKDLGEEYQFPNIKRLRENKHTLKVDLSKLSSWDLWFDKIPPNESSAVDTYDLYKYMYSEKIEDYKRKIFYAVIPPEAKGSILKELKYLNITRAYIYPDISKVAEELNKNYCLEK